MAGKIGGSNAVKVQMMATAAALALSACAVVGGDSPTAADVAPGAPADWSGGDDAAGAMSQNWLADFADPRLNALVAEALANNTDIAAAVARFDQAAESARIAGAPRLPSLNATGDASSSRFEVNNTSTETFGVGLAASWEADVWGRVRDGARAGALDADAAAADLADAQLSIAGAVALAWFDLVEARLLRELSQDELETQERSLRLTQRRYERGVTGALDVRLARSAVATAEAALAQSEDLEERSARSLEVLLARYPGAELDAAAALPVLPPLTGLGAPGDILARRPDLRAAEARLDAAGLRSDVARKALLPQLTLTASGGTSAGVLEDAFDPEQIVSRAAGSLVAPLFQGGRLRAEVRRSDAAVRAQVAAYAGAVLTAYQEAENALASEDALARQDVARAVAADEAVEAERLAERNYTRGVGTIFDLLNAQSRRINAERSLISVRKERVANRVRLHLAVGGGFNVGQMQSDASTSAPQEMEN